MARAPLPSARIVLDQVSRQIGQSFVIENRPGGGGTIGAAVVAKADPDGYTALLHSSSLSEQLFRDDVAATVKLARDAHITPTK